MKSLEQKAESVTYKFATPYDPRARIIYVNVIPQYDCSNSCLFCSKEDAIKGLTNIYEKKAGTNLYLEKAPNVDEIVEAVGRNLKSKISEIAFVGLGEPLLQFSLVRDSIREIKKKNYKGKIRVDSNGLVKCWYSDILFGCFEVYRRNPARELREAGLDEIRISLNAINQQDYNELCRPRFKNAFEKLCGFVGDCIKEGIETKASFVVDFDKSRNRQEYIDFALSLGIKPSNIILRQYVKPIE